MRLIQAGEREPGLDFDQLREVEDGTFGERRAAGFSDNTARSGRGWSITPSVRSL